MKTKNIFKALAFVMLMPAMLLTTACSSDDYDVITEKANPEGYKIPVTVNVTRQGDEATTRALYDSENTKLAFGWGDLLFVNGTHATAGKFAGTLDWQSGGTFRGELSTQYSYTGTADALLSGATTVEATLLPDGYNTCKFLVISGSGYSATLSRNYGYALTLDKASAVEQLSYEHTSTYSSGFALAPGNAIVSFAIGGLTVNSGIIPEFNADGNYYGNKKYVTVNASGIAEFAIGVDGSLGEKHWYLAEHSPIFSTFDLGNKSLVAGHIYNVTKIAVINIINPVVGQVIGDDGKNYDYDSSAPNNGLPDGVSAVAKIAYVGNDAETDATYNHGLALALTDANNGEAAAWCSQNTATCLTKRYSSLDTADDMAGIANTNALVGHGSHTHAAASAARNYKYAPTAEAGAHPTGTSAWFLPSTGQWVKMIAAMDGNTALRDGFSSVGGTNMQAAYYWSSTEYNANSAWLYNLPFNNFSSEDKYGTVSYVRPCLAF